MSEQGHLTGGTLEAKNHPGNPREYFGPIKTNPDELFIHTTEDLKNPDHFLEFLIGNGQMICRMDALCSQHLQGRKTRGTMGLNHSDAWGAEAFPYHRCRPAGRLYNNLLLTPEQKDLELAKISNYLQKVDMEAGIMETIFDWEQGDCRGSTTIKVFVSQVDPDIMVLRFCDRVDKGTVRRTAAIETQVPYEYRLINHLRLADRPAQPGDNSRYDSDEKSSQWLSYEFSSDVMSTKFLWYGRAIASPQQRLQLKLQYNNRGGMAFMWDCPAGEQRQVDIVYAVVSDRSTPDPLKKAAAVIDGIDRQGIDQYQNQHTEQWRTIWKDSSLRLKNHFWQKQFEIARYTLLINSGGNWLGNIACDEPAWDAHMLDSVMALNALVEWGHIDLVKKAYESLDRLYPGAVENARLVSEYIGEKLIDEAALLPTFLTYDGKVALYAVNHFMLHSEQNSGHSLGLLKLADYTGDMELLNGSVYRWLRAYANYALLISEWNDDFNGYVFPLWKAGTLQEGEWWHFQMKALPVEKLESIADLFPEGLRRKKLCCPIDTVLSHKWVLSKAAEISQRLGRDEQLRKRWREVADKIHVPQNGKIILRHEHDDGKKAGHIPSEIWGLFYPCQGNQSQFPDEVIKATLESSFNRRNPLIPSWNGLFLSMAFAMTGDAEKAWQLMQELLLSQDPRCIQAQDNVDTEGFVYYYYLNAAFLLLTLRNMILRNQGGKITLFPAVPRQLEEGVEFENLPVGGAMRVNGKICGDEGEAIFTADDGTVKLKIIGRIRGFSIGLSDLLHSSGETMNV